MIVIIELEDYPQTPAPYNGAAYVGNNEPPDVECEAVRLLHEAVLKVTGKPVVARARARMGFLP